MSALLPLFFGIPLAAAAACVVVPDRRVRRWISLGVTGATLAAAVTLTWVTAGGTTLGVRVGDWPAPFAITFVGDLFASLMLSVAGLMVLACLLFGFLRDEDVHRFYQTLVLVLLAGICGAFLTADLFNLFVFFELLLIASYVLLSLDRSKSQIRAGAVYVSSNLLASTLLLLGVALIYGSTGTVNIATLREVASAPGVIAGGSLMLAAFAVKASLVPVHGWLPVAYPSAPPAVAALFSGLLTKVGIYAIYRIYGVVFSSSGTGRTLLLIIASMTMALGVLGAVGRESMRDILSFHIVSQVGYMVMGIGLLGPLGVAGGIFYIIHHIVVKTTLFLSAGAVETLEGTGALSRLGGVARRNPLLAAAFVVSAFSLAGLPPFSGFWAKLVLVRAAFEGSEYGVAAVSIAVSFLTLMSMIKIYNGVFADGSSMTIPDAEVKEGELVTIAGGATGSQGSRRALLASPAAFLAAVSVAIGLAAPGVLELSERAAMGILDASAYVEAVLGS